MHRCLRLFHRRLLRGTEPPWPVDRPLQLQRNGTRSAAGLCAAARGVGALVLCKGTVVAPRTWVRYCGERDPLSNSVDFE